jgi:diadenosine tetraphosphatase ApaH/serine/threonine PP2A family protein phosphatase
MFLDGDPETCFLEEEYTIPQERRLIVNVGSVGQPRDLDPRLCYCLFDRDEMKVTVRRLDYDRERASQSMLDAGLPGTNAARIMLGR